MTRRTNRERRLSHETRLTLLTFASAAPAALVALALLWGGDHTAKVQWTLTVLIAGCWAGFVIAAREQVVRPLHTVTNLLAALREGDYSIRARGARPNDALGEVLIEVNALGDTLRTQRLGAVEAATILSKVMAEIDVAVFTFDQEKRLRLVNRAGENLLGTAAVQLLGKKASEIGLAECLQSEECCLDLQFPGGSGRWGLRRSSFRENGLPHELLVLTNMSAALREQERNAWQRLVRVIGHELNNSLAPIKSIAGTLETLLKRDPPPADWKEDAEGGLNIIATRAESLSRFMEAYARLARLPPPRIEPLDLGALVRRVASLETRLAATLVPGPEMQINGDPAQIEQLLINILRNAVDASLETGGNLSLGWREAGDCVEVFVEDEGHGLMNSSNLFVPFFTTKPGGSGIGLALSRQIAEAHDGSLTVVNRKDRTGCEALLRLPR